MTDVGAHAATSLHFKDNAKAALADANLQNALKFVEVNFIARRREVADKLPEFEALRDCARDIKDHTLAHLDLYLEAFERRVVEQGGVVRRKPQCFFEPGNCRRTVPLIKVDRCPKADGSSVL